MTSFPRLIAIAICLLACPPLSAVAFARDAPVPLADRARGAERVVVGRVTSVSPTWRTNEFGDRLIVSLVSVAVDETLRGPAQQVVDVEVEGGTIGDITLHVSDLEAVVPVTMPCSTWPEARAACSSRTCAGRAC